MHNSLAAATLIIIALLALAVPQFTVAASAQDQALTVDALDNATYRPVRTETFGDTVQLVKGSYSGTMFGPDGGIRQGSYVFGDLSGDGADDAIAVVVEQTGCCASSINVILVVYANDGGEPRFADSVTLGGASVLDPVVTIDAGTITVSAPVGKQFTIEEGKLVAVTPTPTQSAAPASPGALDGLSSVRSAFPAQVLMPPAGLQPFTPLQLSIVQSPAESYSATGQFGVEYPQSYKLSFINSTEQNQRQFGVARAAVVGAVSRQMYDDNVAASLKTFTGCAPTAAYCGRSNFPRCSGIPCTTQDEIFRGLNVKGSAALVMHEWNEPRNVGWSVTWFDSQAGVTYELTTNNGADPPGFDAGLSAKNLAGAQQLTAVAEKMAPWSQT